MGSDFMSEKRVGEKVLTVGACSGRDCDASVVIFQLGSIECFLRTRVPYIQCENLARLIPSAVLVSFLGSVGEPELLPLPPI